MICIDTSVWVAAQRARHPKVIAALDRVLDNEDVVLPIVVRMELLAGVARRQQNRIGTDLSALALAFPVRGTWERIEAWLFDAAAHGKQFGILDLVIAALAAERGARVWSLDHAFATMAALGWIELYTPGA